MGFTYDLTNDLGRLRLLVGDTVLNAGIKPDQSNYSDEELQAFLDRAGGDLNVGAAELLETLARVWALEPDVKMGPIYERRSDIAKNLRTQATALRDKTGGDSTSFSVGFERDDGYAQAAENKEYYG
jgi:hypothetical protein